MKDLYRPISLALACLALPVASLSVQAATVTELLFTGVANAQVLTTADRQAISALLPVAIGPNGLLVDSECKQASDPVITIRDMNRDGRTEVIVVEGNGCVYGMMGKAVHILASDGQGHWRAVMTVNGDSFHERPAQPGMWPDILPAVVGFCYPIYGYADAQQKYVLKSRTPDPKMPNACKGF